MEGGGVRLGCDGKGGRGGAYSNSWEKTASTRLEQVAMGR